MSQAKLQPESQVTLELMRPGNKVTLVPKGWHIDFAEIDKAGIGCSRRLPDSAAVLGGNTSPPAAMPRGLQACLFDELTENPSASISSQAPARHQHSMDQETSKAWVCTNQAVVALGMSRETLHQRRKSGFFRSGEHWLLTGPHRTSSILWDVQACQAQLARFTQKHQGESQ